MNWKEISTKYPKSFLEWIRGYRKDRYITSVVVQNFTVLLAYETPGFSYAQISAMNREVYGLPYYFDNLGIEINATGDPSKVFGVEIITASGLNYYFKENGKWSSVKYCEKRPKAFPDRLAATIAGAEKAFEIREAQLNIKP